MIVEEREMVEGMVGLARIVAETEILEKTGDV